MLMPPTQQQKHGKGIEPQQLITEVKENDVLLGRGNHVHNPGNGKFRAIVLSRSVEYWCCNNNIKKDSIARQIIDQISTLGGRFLRKRKGAPKGQKPSDSVTGDASGDNIDGMSGDNVDGTEASVPETWEIADMETVLVKVKQTFRDFTASAKKRTATTSPPVMSRDAIQETDNTSNILPWRNERDTSLFDLGRREDVLFSSGVVDNRGFYSIAPSTSSIALNDSLNRTARMLQLDNVQSVLNQTNVRSDIEELLVRQRTVASWQEHLRQQDLVSALRGDINRNGPLDTQTSLLTQNNTNVQDQLLLRQLLSQRTPQLQMDQPTIASAISRQSMMFLPNEANVPRTIPDHLLQPLEELGRVRQQQLLEYLDLATVAPPLFGLLPQHLASTNALRQLRSGPAFETPFPLSNTNRSNNLDIAVANAIAGHSLLPNVMTSATSQQSEDLKNSVGDDDENERKPPWKRKK